MSDKANWRGNTEVVEGDIAFQGTVRFLAGTNCIFADPTDSTKTCILDLSGLPTGTRTDLAIPDSDSSIVTLTGTQTLTNKTLTAPALNGGTWVATDSTFTIADNSTPTKIANFQCSGLSAGTNVFTFPQTAADTLVCAATAQTLTNKTLTSPVLGGTATGTDFAVDLSGTLTLDAATDIDVLTAGDWTDTITGNYTSTVTGARTLSSAEDTTIEGTGAGDDVILQAPFAASRVFVNGGLTLVRATTAISASTSYQNILGVTDNSSGRTITLEADMNLAGRIIAITDEAGTAGSSNNITITPESGTIDGMAGDTINTNYGKRIYYGDGTNWHSLVSTVRPGQVYFMTAPGSAKVGATAGWVVAAAADTSRVTLPAGQSASTLVLPIVAGLKVGWTITGFYLVGQIESAGNTATLDANLFKLTAAAADITDASIGAIAQISVTADTEVSAANSTKTLDTPEVIAANESFYVLITGTTAADTDVDLMGVALIVTES